MLFEGKSGLNPVKVASAERIVSGDRFSLFGEDIEAWVSCARNRLFYPHWDLAEIHSNGQIEQDDIGAIRGSEEAVLLCMMTDPVVPEVVLADRNVQLVASPDEGAEIAVGQREREYHIFHFQTVFTLFVRQHDHRIKVRAVVRRSPFLRRGQGLFDVFPVIAVVRGQCKAHGIIRVQPGREW